MRGALRCGRRPPIGSPALSHVTIHIGSRKTATTYIQHALGRNEETLRRAGIHLPRSGRFTLNPGNISHHHLAFELEESPRFRPASGGWDDLVAELAEPRPEDRVLISCEVFEGLVVEDGMASTFLDHVRRLGEPTTVVLVVRDWFSFINSMYNQAIKMFAIDETLEEYVRRGLDAGDAGLVSAFRPFVEADFVDFRVLHYRDLRDPDPLTALLRAVDLLPDGLSLDVPDRLVNTSLGAIGLEVTTILNKYLVDRHDDWQWHSDAAQRLHIESLVATNKRGWNDTRYWGWGPAMVEEFADRIIAEQDAFARLVWGAPWPEPWPLDRELSVSTFADYPPHLLDAALEHVTAMDARYRELRRAA